MLLFLLAAAEPFQQHASNLGDLTLKRDHLQFWLLFVVGGDVVVGVVVGVASVALPTQEGWECLQRLEHYLGVAADVLVCVATRGADHP